MCGNSNIPEPAERGVWWKDDKTWVQYPQHIADQIVTAYRNGDERVSLGCVKSAKYPDGVYYSVDLINMQQTNRQSGFTRSVKIVSPPNLINMQQTNSQSVFPRPVKIVPAPNLINMQQTNSQSGFTRSVKIVSPKIVSPPNNDSTVKMVPTYTIDLNTHTPSPSDQFNITVKIPNNTFPTSALMHKTGELLLEKITRKAFVEAVLKKRGKGFPGYEWKAQNINPFVYGNSDDGHYAQFLTKFLALVDSNPSTLDGLFGIVEKGNTEQGGPVEYLFKEDNQNAYARNVLGLENKVGVYLAIGSCVSTSFLGQAVTVGDSSNIVHVGDVVAVVSDNDY